MRFMVFAIAGILVGGVAGPSFAAKARTPPKSIAKTFEQCQHLALKAGVPPGQNGHREFVEQCRSGKPGSGGRARGVS